MQESVVYQELRAEARQEVRAEVYQEVRAEVYQEARFSGGRSLVLHLLTRRVGTLSDAARSHVEALSLSQLESLGEALLDFSSLSDLDIWLAEHSELPSGN